MTQDKTDTIDAGENKDDSDESEKFDQDSFWKEIIDRFCYYLLKRAVPELYEKADITKNPRSLKTEFTDILNTGKRKLHKKPRFTDVVLEIPLKDGAAEWVLFHCEAQGKGSNLAERMFHYMCLIYAHHRRNPVALAIVTGGHKKEKRFFSHNHFGTESIYRYNNLVLADLNDEELQASDNPIDLALYAAKCALLAKEERQKYNYLRTLIDLLGERGWNRDDKRDLLLYLERIMDLQDEELEKEYVEYRNMLNREGKIMYIPLGEREEAKKIKQSGIAEGMAQGKEEMAREVVIKLLARGDYTHETISDIAGVPVEHVRTLAN